MSAMHIITLLGVTTDMFTIKSFFSIVLQLIVYMYITSRMENAYWRHTR